MPVEIVQNHMTMTIHGETADVDMMRRCMYDQRPMLDTKAMTVHLVRVSSSIGSVLEKCTFEAVVMSHLTTSRTIRLLKLKFGNDLRYTINYNTQPIEILGGGPRFLYRHKKVKFDCPHCGVSNLTADKLESDAFPDGEGGENYVTNMCPKCKECIEVHHERLTDTDMHELAKSNEKKYTRPKPRRKR